MRAAFESGATTKDIAQDYGLCYSHVYRVVRGQSRKKSRPTKADIKAHLHAYHAKWREKNRERLRLQGRLAQHAMQSPGQVATAEWLAILDVFDHRCAYCGVRDQLMIEHVIPKSQGGRHIPENVVPACGSCNYVKGKQGPLAMANRNFGLRDA